MNRGSFLSASSPTFAVRFVDAIAALNDVHKVALIFMCLMARSIEHLKKKRISIFSFENSLFSLFAYLSMGSFIFFPFLRTIFREQKYFAYSKACELLKPNQTKQTKSQVQTRRAAVVQGAERGEEEQRPLLLLPADAGQRFLPSRAPSLLSLPVWNP